MKTRLALAALLLAAPFVQAQRPLPADLVVGRLTAANGAAISLAPPTGGLMDALSALFSSPERSFAVTPALRVYDPDNRLVLTGELPRWLGSPVGASVDFMGNVNRIWVLSDEEIAARVQQLEALSQ